MIAGWNESRRKSRAGFEPHGGRDMHEKQGNAIDRRNFLRASLGGATTAAVAAAAAIAPEEAQAYDPGDEETRSRYQETEHVKAFYRVNSYPTARK